MTKPPTPALLALAAALLLTGLLLRFPPDHYSFYPQCPIHAWTGFLCPGCGATRAVAALLRGHLAEALQQNAIIVGFTPFLLGYTTVCFTRLLRSNPLIWPQPPRWTISLAFVLTAAFTLARNLSLHP